MVGNQRTNLSKTRLWYVSRPRRDVVLRCNPRVEALPSQGKLMMSKGGPKVKARVTLYFITGTGRGHTNRHMAIITGRWWLTRREIRAWDHSIWNKKTDINKLYYISVFCNCIPRHDTGWAFTGNILSGWGCEHYGKIAQYKFNQQILYYIQLNICFNCPLPPGSLGGIFMDYPLRFT